MSSLHVWCLTFQDINLLPGLDIVDARTECKREVILMKVKKKYGLLFLHLLNRKYHITLFNYVHDISVAEKGP